MDIWTEAMSRYYQRSIDGLEQALRACPDALWKTSLWVVRKEESPHLWPIKRGGEGYSDDAKLQMYSAFWNVAYHTIFFLDFYLSGGPLPFELPQPFRVDDFDAGVLPQRVYSRAELLGYLSHGREKARVVLAQLTEQQLLRGPVRGRQSFADLLLANLLHVREHSAQMSMLLGQRASV